MWAKSILLLHSAAIVLTLLQACDAFVATHHRLALDSRLASNNGVKVFKLCSSSGNKDDATPLTPREEAARGAQSFFRAAAAMVFASNIAMGASLAEETPSPDFYSPVESIETAPAAAPAPIAKILPPFEPATIKLPYSRNNVPFTDFVGKKATIIFNMKIDDPQTVLQFPELNEIYNKYKGEGLNMLAFPTEQGWFEPDDDETCRAKAKEFFGFGQYPSAVVFDKVDILGPSASPLFTQLTKSLPTPNGYGRITLNYEKFLLDSTGTPVRRYPRKFSAYDFELDIVALLRGEPLPAETPLFLKAWREAKREALKSEYAFRYNYNYYTAPDSMYKFNEANDKQENIFTKRSNGYVDLPEK